MTRSERLKPVSRLAENREQRAAIEMAGFRRTLEAQQARLDELRRFRRDYTQRFEESGRRGLDAARVADFRRILAQLGEAIVWQEERVRGMQGEYEILRRHWSNARTHTAAIEKARARFRREEQQVGERREQFELDEGSLRRFVHRHAE
ncbi:MAG: flagellar export protein FliJ [Gammaproteobacteria bacterium]|nr:flagellar export protein FliJ [Gammaproteobacteria bacterium]